MPTQSIETILTRSRVLPVITLDDGNAHADACGVPSGRSSFAPTAAACGCECSHQFIPANPVCKFFRRRRFARRCHA